jgi:tetratricopeptide (TPR) repeat protein
MGERQMHGDGAHHTADDGTLRGSVQGGALGTAPRSLLRDKARRTLAGQDRFLRAYAAGQAAAGSSAPAQEKLGPLVKRQIFHIPAESGVGVGWAQLPRLGGRLIALGIFPQDDMFSQVALADWHGRVFLAPAPMGEAAGLSVDFTFIPERTEALRVEWQAGRQETAGQEKTPSGPDDGTSAGTASTSGTGAAHARPAGKTSGTKAAGAAFSRLWGRLGAAARTAAGAVSSAIPGQNADRRIGMASNPLADAGRTIPDGAVVHGAMLSGLDTPDDDPRWVASWVQRGGRYDLTELKMPLEPRLRHDLSYRDAVAIGFFAAGYLPLVAGYPEGYGSGAVFRLLREQAPMAAVRNTVGTITANALAGYRISGLDRFFLSLPDQLGFFEGGASRLLPEHGLEPTTLTTSAYSRAFQLHSRVTASPVPGNPPQGSLDLTGELEALRLESALNRFALLSAVLETNAITGAGPVEEDADERTVCDMDRAILRDPVLTALPVPGSVLWRGQDNAFDEAGDQAYGGPAPDVASYLLRAGGYAAATTDHLLREEQKAGRPAQKGEWLYRQSLSRMYEMLRLPLRADVDFRCSLSDGRVAVEAAAVETGLLPDKLYAGGRYLPASDEDKKALAARQSLEEGLLLAALAFGASSQVNKVSLLITDNRLTQAADIGHAEPGPGLLDRLGLVHRPSGKGEAKDRDRHGDPETTPIVPDVNPFASDPLGHAVGDELDEPTVTGQEPADHPGGPDADDQDGQYGRQSGTPDDGARAGADDQTRQPGEDAGEMDGAAMDDEDDGDEDDGGDDDDPVAAGLAGVVSPQHPELARVAAAFLGSALPGTDMPTLRRLVTVTFTRDEFERDLRALAGNGDFDMIAFYRRHGAVLRDDGHGGLLPAASPVSLRDLDYTPDAAQEEPEAAQRRFDARARRELGAKDSLGLSIQREEVLQTALDYVKQLRREEEAGTRTSVEAAKAATAFLDKIADPELEAVRESLIRALIDRTAVPDVRFTDAVELRSTRDDLIHSAIGGMEPRKAIDQFEDTLARADRRYGSGPGVPRFFNSYAERVVYNRLFATPGETTLVIPDDLFYGHLLLADAYGNSSERESALRHLNKAVSYAPSYAMIHLRQSVQFARAEDWPSARAACLNALNVAVDRLDAGYAYYRLAYAEWQLDRLQPAAACYQTALLLGQNAGGALEGELEELSGRMRSQGIEVPQTDEQVRSALDADSLPLWPDRQISTILEEATHVSVDEGMFVPARTIARAWARVNRSHQNGIDMVQARFLRSLEA